MKDIIHLPLGDAAILLGADGGIQLLLPKGRGEENPPEHVQLAMAFCVVARNPVLSQIVCSMADAEALDMSDAEMRVTQ